MDSTVTMSRSATVAFQTPQASSRPTTKESCKTSTPQPLPNAIAEIEFCPLKGECLTENIVYIAKVSNKKNEEGSYIGLMERSFKDRLYKHRNSLRHRANTIELSKYVWDLRDRNTEEINMEWSILDK